MTYPSYDQLVQAGYTPEPTYIGAAIARAIQGRAPLASVKSEERPKRNAYFSPYVGVARHATGFRPNWAGTDGRYKVGKTVPTERDAAVARAQALGRDWLERRDGTREAL